MITLKKILILLAIGLSTISSYSHGGELEERSAIMTEVSDAFNAAQFSKLESLSQTYLNTQARTSSGVWKLTFFYDGITSSFAYKRLDKPYWSKVESLMNQWIKLYPNSATARLAYARMLCAHAWTIRGDGLADTVKKKNWQPFNSLIEQERLYLVENKKLASTDPQWYTEMLSIATNQSWSEPEFASLFKEAADRYPNFYQIYFSAMDYYVPKWGGNAVQLEQFARDANARNVNTEGNGLYTRIYWAASQSQYNTDLFRDSFADWPTMKKGIDDILKKYPDSWNINNFAFFACIAGDKAKTLELINKIQGSPIASAWYDISNYDSCKNFALSK